VRRRISCCLAAQGLHDKVAHHAPSSGYARAVRIEDARHLDLQAMLAVSIEECVSAQRLPSSCDAAGRWG